MKVLLTTLNAKYIHTNLAIRILYEMNHSNKNLHWKEFAIKEDKNKIAGQCLSFDVIAFSCYIWNIAQTLELIRLIKKFKPQIKILLGGPEVSYDYEEIIKQPEIDFIISGEGEIPFKQFLENYGNFSLVQGLTWKNENGIQKNSPASNYDVNNFSGSMPYRFDDPEELKNKVLYVETSRGCPYKCEFCLASLDNKVRYLPMESVKETLLFMMKNGKVIKFLDRTFNIKKTFTLDIFQFILDNYQPGNIFQFEITADILHPEIIRFVNEKIPRGLFRFEIGIQSVNQEANLAVSRKQDFEKTKSIIKSVESKVELHLDLIVGLPHDYFEDIKRGIEEVFRLYPSELQLGFLKFLKGTPVREKYAEHDYVFGPNPPYQIVQSKFLSKTEIENITRAEEALEIYWNDKRTVRTLKYVSQNYAVYDFLQETGWLFHSRFRNKQHSLNDIYETIYSLAETNYRDDIVLRELIAIDYYSSQKVKPKALFSIGLDKKSTNKIIEELRLNHHQFRHIILPLHFDHGKFETENLVVRHENNLILEYSGKDYPKFISEKIAV